MNLLGVLGVILIVVGVLGMLTVLAIGLVPSIIIAMGGLLLVVFAGRGTLHL